MLHGRDNSPVRSIRVRQSGEEPVDDKELVKGYEYEPGHYAILDDEVFRQVALRTTGWRPTDFDLRSMRQRLDAVGDLWTACRTDANDVREVVELL